MPPDKIPPGHNPTGQNPHSSLRGTSSLDGSTLVRQDNSRGITFNMGGDSTTPDAQYSAAFDRLNEMWQSTKERLELERHYNEAWQFTRDHPVVTLFVLVTTIMCSIPIFCFMAFTLGSIILTFTGFMFLEGAVLTIAALVLSGALFIVAFCAVGFSAFLVTSFYLINWSYTVLNQAANKYHTYWGKEGRVETITGGTADTTQPRNTEGR